MTTLEISNIHCQNCVKKIKDELSEEFGPISISDDLKYISFDADVKEFSDALADLGFILHAAN